MRFKVNQIVIGFETTNLFFFKFCINLQCHKIQLLCTFLAEILYTFKRSLSRRKFGEIESLKFGTLMGSFCQNNIRFQLKKYRRWHEEFYEFSLNHTKVQKFHFHGQFLSKIYMRFDLKNTEELSFMTLNSDEKFE